ncbi:hypothetical protein N7513_006541 [Penicillium frequentans]|nr:hypothetical protein N7513_006541 [Penicillium glabrum]
MSLADTSKQVRTSVGMEVVQASLEVDHRHAVYYLGDTPLVKADPPPKRTVCGLRRVTFWLTMCIVLMTIVVFAIAIGLAMGLTHQNNSRMNFWADTLNSTTPISCPSADNSIQTMNAQKYLIHCDYDFMGDKSILMMLPNMTLHDCLYACDSMNAIQQRDDIGSTFYDQDTLVQQPGNCWCVGNATQTTRAPGRVAAIPQK